MISDMKYSLSASGDAYQSRIFPPRLLKILRVISLIAILFKFSSISIWPHMYIGESYTAPSWKNYLDFAITCLSIGTLFAHIEYIHIILKKNVLMLVFCLIAICHPILVGSNLLIVDLLVAFNYLAIVSAIMLTVRIDGIKTVVNILLTFGVFFVAVNILSLAQPSRSFMRGVAMPNILLSNVPAFRGLTPHRNDLSWMAFLFLFGALSDTYGFPRLLKWFVMVGCVLLIFLASSVQGILLSLFGLLVLLVAHDPKILRSPVFITFAAPILLGACFFALSPESLEAFLNFFGRDLTFTGRDRIWAISFERMRGMPWYGYGQGSLALSKISPELLAQFGVGSAFGTAHNSYIEAILTYGWVGASVFFLLVGSQLVKALGVLFSSKNRQNHLCFVLILTCIIGGFTASEKLFLPGAGWLVFCLGVFILDKSIQNKLSTKHQFTVQS